MRDSTFIFCTETFMRITMNTVSYVDIYVHSLVNSTDQLVYVCIRLKAHTLIGVKIIQRLHGYENASS